MKLTADPDYNLHKPTYCGQTSLGYSAVTWQKKQKINGWSLVGIFLVLFNLKTKKKKGPNQKLKVAHFLEEASVRAVTWYSWAWNLLPEQHWVLQLGAHHNFYKMHTSNSAIKQWPRENSR